MKPKTIGIIAAIAIVTNMLWITTMIAMEGNAPVFVTLAERIDFIESKAILYRISYLGNAFLTLVGTVYMTSLFIHSKPKSEFWSTVAFVFVPIYSILNLISYLSQVMIVPPLIDQFNLSETNEIASVFLNLTLHNWPGSIVESLNGLAYALLGIPSIIFPYLIMKRPKVLALGGIMLALSGVLAIIAFTGILLSNKYFTTISVIGGILATLADFPIAYHFLYGRDNEGK